MEEEPTSDDPVARFEEVFRIHYGPALAYLRRRTDNAGDAEDLAAATFLAVWRRIDEVPAGPVPRRWILRIAEGQLSNLRRGRRRRGVLLQRLVCQLPRGRQTDVDDIEDPSDEGLAMLAFTRLRRPDQEVLSLITWEDLSRTEAAALLGCSENALNIRLHRARRSLQREYEALSETTKRRRGQGRLGGGAASEGVAGD